MQALAIPKATTADRASITPNNSRWQDLTNTKDLATDNPDTVSNHVFSNDHKTAISPSTQDNIVAEFKRKEEERTVTIENNSWVIRASETANARAGVTFALLILFIIVAVAFEIIIGDYIFALISRRETMEPLKCTNILPFSVRWIFRATRRAKIQWTSVWSSRFQGLAGDIPYTSVHPLCSPDLCTRVVVYVYQPVNKREEQGSTGINKRPFRSIASS